MIHCLVSGWHTILGWPWKEILGAMNGLASFAAVLVAYMAYKFGRSQGLQEGFQRFVIQHQHQDQFPRKTLISYYRRGLSLEFIREIIMENPHPARPAHDVIAKSIYAERVITDAHWKLRLARWVRTKILKRPF